MAVKKGEYEYEGKIPNALFKLKIAFFIKGEEWDVVSDECKNLIKKMLSKPDFRFNSEMVMASKWI